MTQHLVTCKDYNGHKNVRFVMKSDDFRLGTSDWTTIADGQFEKGWHSDSSYQRRFRAFRLADGTRLAVFSDNSVGKAL